MTLVCLFCYLIAFVHIFPFKVRQVSNVAGNNELNTRELRHRINLCLSFLSYIFIFHSFPFLHFIFIHPLNLLVLVLVQQGALEVRGE